MTFARRHRLEFYADQRGHPRRTVWTTFASRICPVFRGIGERGRQEYLKQATADRSSRFLW